MFSRKLITAAITIAAAGTFAGSAQASVVDTDEFALRSIGYDFAGPSWTAPNPTDLGEVHFHHENGVIRPHVIGGIHLNDAAGTCGRMRIRYYNKINIQLAERFGGTVCVNDDQHHSWTVDLDTYSDDDIASVEVAVMKITATGEYVADSSDFDVNTFSDLVNIDRAGIDLGGPTWGGSAATDSASVSWPLDGADVSPHVIGTLHMNHNSGGCGRVNLRYLAEDGTQLDERHGGTVCSPDNGHHQWSVDLQSYTSDEIDGLVVEIQTLAVNGSYVTAGSQTVSIAE